MSCIRFARGAEVGTRKVSMAVPDKGIERTFFVLGLFDDASPSADLGS